MGCRVREFNRITSDPGFMRGHARIRGMGITVGMILEQLGTGHSVEQVLGLYPCLERDDISQALLYASRRVQTQKGRRGQEPEQSVSIANRVVLWIRRNDTALTLRFVEIDDRAHRDIAEELIEIAAARLRQHLDPKAAGAPT